MAEYIEREALIGAIDCVFFKTDPDGAEQIGVLSCRRAIREFPAADVAPVVRCDQCEYWATESLDEDGWCENPNGLDNIAKKTDFCSYGKKRMDGE